MAGKRESVLDSGRFTALACALVALAAAFPRAAGAEEPASEVASRQLAPARHAEKSATPATTAALDASRAAIGERRGVESGQGDGAARWYLNWRVWGGTGVGCALIGAGLFIAARETASDSRGHYRASPERAFAAELSAERRHEGSKAGAIAAFSLAGVSLGGAAWLWFRQREEERASGRRPRERRAALAPLFGGGKFGLAVRVGF